MDLQRTVRRIGLVTGPVLAALLYLTLPHEYQGAAGEVVPFTSAGRATLAMMAWMASWWMTEAVEIEVTSLLPIVAFPLFGIMAVGKTTANYGADVIFLFLGGFVLALSIQRWGLDRRIAFQTLKWVGTRPRAIVAGVMGATAVVSMWVSNTATAAMMVPIALSIVDLSLRRRTGRSLADHGGIPQDDVDDRNLALSLLLGVPTSFALVRGKALDVPVLLGSATPALETLHNAQAGRYLHLRLRQRAGGARAAVAEQLTLVSTPMMASV